MERLHFALDTAYTYESNRIEGNTLTLSETNLVINEGITVAGKTINHKEPFRNLVPKHVRDVRFRSLAMVSGNIGQDVARKGWYVFERMAATQ